MRRMACRLSAAVAAVVMSTVITALPARAATGGGCEKSVVTTSCISYSGSLRAILPDFWQDAGLPYLSKAVPVIHDDNNYRDPATYRLAPVTIYGPGHYSIAAWPVVGHGEAYVVWELWDPNQVVLYYTATSRRQIYP